MKKSDKNEENSIKNIILVVVESRNRKSRNQTMYF